MNEVRPMNMQRLDLSPLKQLQSQRFRRLRAFLGLTAADLAARVEIAQQQWSGYEHGRTLPRRPTMRAIVKAARDLGWHVEPAWLLGESEAEPSQISAQPASAREPSSSSPSPVPALGRFDVDDLVYGAGFHVELPLYEVCQTPLSYQFVTQLRDHLILPYPIWLDPGFYRLLWVSDSDIKPCYRRDMLLLCHAFTPERRDLGRPLCLWQAGQSGLHFGFLQDDVHQDHWVIRPFPLGSTLPVIVWDRTALCRCGRLSVVHHCWSRRSVKEFVQPDFPRR
jgi:DNA-binding XRE family transcriptional regulator